MIGDERIAACGRVRLSANDVRGFFGAARRVDRIAFHDLPMSRCHAAGSPRLRDGTRGRWFVHLERRGSLRLADGRTWYFFCLACRSSRFDPVDEDDRAIAIADRQPRAAPLRARAGRWRPSSRRSRRIPAPDHARRDFPSHSGSAAAPVAGDRDMPVAPGHGATEPLAEIFRTLVERDHQHGATLPPLVIPASPSNRDGRQPSLVDGLRRHRRRDDEAGLRFGNASLGRDQPLGARTAGAGERMVGHGENEGGSDRHVSRCGGRHGPCKRQEAIGAAGIAQPRGRWFRSAAAITLASASRNTTT